MQIGMEKYLIVAFYTEKSNISLQIKILYDLLNFRKIEQRE